MHLLLSYNILVEPDIQRVSTLVMDALRGLGCNLFATTRLLLKATAELRQQLQREGDPIEIEIHLENNTLSLYWKNHHTELYHFSDSPPDEHIEQTRQQLKLESEFSDPSLLKRRNEKIRQELDEATRKAAAVERLKNQLNRKQEELQVSIENAEKDSLTGLFNRRAFDNRLKEFIPRCNRQLESLSLLLFDLDNFKEINDDHGHQYGDAYLKRMAETMSNSCRENVDFACRIGGDEFAIIAFSNHATANRMAEHILKRMDSKVSIGIAQYEFREHQEDFVKRCDEALYSAKKCGRGQISYASPPTKRLQLAE